ncbi:FAD binding domain-containing protein [Agrobacterium pusense]|uniref:FAD binding domain-containing protein n=1 Tax=Agrobacterium pusense TaxID=648995 RepID=UPI003FD2F0ED
MKPASFEYERPSTIDEAVAALARHGDDAKVLAGGQSLIPLMNLRMVQFGTVVDIGRLAELRSIAFTQGELRIGSLATHNSILTSDVVAQHVPLITEAYHDVAHHSVRNRGTLGGSLCHNDPASEMPLIMSVLGARLVARSESGEREIPVEEFLVSAFTTALEPEELLTEIRVPIPHAGHGYAFSEIAQRKGDFALVACAVVLTLDAGVGRDVRVGYRNVGSETVRLPEVEAVLEGRLIDEAAILEAAGIAKDVIDPPDDIHATADYRREITATLTERVVTRAVAKAKKG